LTEVTAGILRSWEPFVKAISGAIDSFNNSGASFQGFVGNVLGFGQAVNIFAGHMDKVSLALQAIAGALGLLSLTNFATAIGGLSGLASGAIGLTAALFPLPAILAAVGAGIALDKVLEAVIPGWKEHREVIADNVSVMHGAAEEFDYVADSADEAGQVIGQQKDIWQQLVEELEKIPEKVSTEIEATGTAYTKAEIEEIQKAFAGLGDKKTIGVQAEADVGSFKRVGEILIQELPTGHIIFTQTKIDQPSVDATKNKLDQDLPTEKQIEITLKGAIDIELAKIQTQAETLQKSFEWQAKVDIAEIENLFETLRTQSDNIRAMFESTGDVLVGLAGALGDISSLARLEVFELMKEESARRDLLLAEQQKLTEAQVKYLDARTEAMNKGQGIITVEASGLEVELQLVLQRIVELAQIRANEEGLNFLLGVT
jgi:hypothetical protein